MTADQELTEFLRQYVTENKQQIMANALEQRTRYLTVMLEDIYQPHNASACLRSCEDMYRGTAGTKAVPSLCCHPLRHAKNEIAGSEIAAQADKDADTH